MLERKRNSNNFIIGTLLVAIIGMVVGYAALSTSLSVNGTSTIASTTSFDIKFTGVTTTPTGMATSTHTSFENNTTSNTFSFALNLNQPGDKMVYNVTLKNIGTIAAEVGSFTNPEAWEMGDILTYSVTGISIGEVIEAQGTKNITITVEWPAGTDIPTNKTQELEFQIHFIQQGTGSGEVAQ